MAEKHKKSSRPQTKATKNNLQFERAQPKTDFDDEHPKFCFRYVQPGHDPKTIDPDKQGAMLMQMQNLGNLSWKQIKTSPRHGLGTEFINANSIIPPIPTIFADETRFMFFRYCGKLPMGGIRIRDIFHVLWIENEFGNVYEHGS